MHHKIVSGLTSIVAAIGSLAALVLLPSWALTVVCALLVAWLAFTSVGRQSWSVAKLGIATLPQRPGAASVVVVGIAGVVGVLVALLSLAQGLESTIRQVGTDDTAVILRAGSQTEINSTLERDTATVAGEEPQVLRDARRQPLASPELVMVAALPKESDGSQANVAIRGVGEEAWDVHPDVRLIAGRRFNTGLRQLIVGKAAAREFKGMTLGSSVELDGQPWTVVGEFESGNAHESELWADGDVMASVYHHGSGVSSLTVRLASSGLFDAFKAALAADPRLRVDVATTREYYQKQSEALSRLIRTLGITVSIIMALGATFGALNTMYTSVAARTREIATLRATGFRGGPVIVSVLIETVLLALAGGGLGAMLAWALFDHYTASTLGSNFSQVIFEFRVTPSLVATGLKWAVAIGLVGGLLPALRAARMSVTAGLREL